MLRRCLHVGHFFVVLALPQLFVMLFRHTLGMGQRMQLGEVLTPGFLFFRRQPDTVFGLRLRFGRGGRRMVMMFRGIAGDGGSKHGQSDESR